MRVLGANMAWLMKALEAGRPRRLSPAGGPAQTNFIR